MKTRLHRNLPAARLSSRTSPAPARPRCRAPRLGKILVPVDFSTESKQAFHYATQLARRSGATISLVHVVEPVSFETDCGYGPVLRHLPNTEAIKRARTKLTRIGKTAVGREWLDEIIVRSGIAFFEITEAARLAKTELIIIGSHGHAGFAGPDLGSTAEKVVRHAPCPVLVVHRREREFNV